MSEHRPVPNGYYRQAWKQTNGDPSGVNWNYRGITLLYKFTTVLSVTAAKIVARLLKFTKR